MASTTATSGIAPVNGIELGACPSDNHLGLEVIRLATDAARCQ